MEETGTLIDAERILVVAIKDLMVTSENEYQMTLETEGGTDLLISIHDEGVLALAHVLGLAAVEVRANRAPNIEGLN